jgi:membrane-associated protein
MVRFRCLAMEILADLMNLLSARGLEQTLAQWIALYGPWALALVAAIVFAETGFVVTPFLPGDSLLFLTGTAIAAAGYSVHAAVVVLIAAAILGNSLNFAIGRTAAHWLLPRLHGRWLRPAHIEMTHAYFERWGGATIVVSRFVPIVRTIAPFLAGAGDMAVRRFTLFNVVGGVAWVVLFVYAGALLGSLPVVRQHLGWLALAIIVLSLLPIVFGALKARRAARG